MFPPRQIVHQQTKIKAESAVHVCNEQYYVVKCNAITKSVWGPDVQVCV